MENLQNILSRDEEGQGQMRQVLQILNERIGQLVETMRTNQQLMLRIAETQTTLGPALQRLTETVQHHVKEEEGDVFDAARRSLDPETLDEVTAEFTEHRRQQLERLGGSDDGYADLNKDELLAEARERDLPGRSSMSRDELISHLRASD